MSKILEDNDMRAPRYHTMSKPSEPLLCDNRYMRSSPRAEAPEFVELLQEETAITDYSDVTWNNPFLCSLQSSRFSMRIIDKVLVGQDNRLAEGTKTSKTDPLRVS